MGFALNAARDPDFNDFSLSHEVAISFFPADMPQAAIANMKTDFEAWAVSNAIRELIEAFSVFLDRLYEYSLLAKHSGQKLTARAYRQLNSMKRKGLPGKQLMLQDDYDITSELAGDLKTLYEARNCLAHARGIVTPEFCNVADALEIRWRAVELLLKRSSGDEVVIELREDAQPVAGPGELLKRTVVRTRRFPIGTVFKLAPVDLAEICVFVYLAADSFLFPAIEYAKKHGVE